MNNGNEVNGRKRPARTGWLKTRGQPPAVTKDATSKEYGYAKLGLIGGFVLISIGAALFWYGIQGPEGIRMSWGIEMVKPGAGGVMVAIGVAVIWLTRPHAVLNS